MQQTPPPLFDSEQFVRQTSALKDALQSLSNTTKKPSFLMLEPNFVPNDWDAENVPLSVLELLGVSINAIQEETSRWKSKYFTKEGTGFHSIDFQNRGAGKRYIIAVQNDLSMQICSSKDADELTIRKESQEHQDLLRYYEKHLLVINGTAPVPVTPTNSESASQTFFDQSTLRINANTSKQKCGSTTNCITPTSTNIEDLESNDNQQSVPEDFFSTFDAEPKVKAALETLYQYVGSVEGNELPKHVQAFVCHAMMKCGNSDSKNNIYTIKHCSAQNTRLRFDTQHFQHITLAKGNVTTNRAIANKANAIKAQLDLSVGNDPHQCKEIMKQLQIRLGLEHKKADASTQTFEHKKVDASTQSFQSDTSEPTLKPKRRKCRKYWISKKAFNLFGVHQADDEEEQDANVPDALEQEFDNDNNSREIFADLKCIVRKRIDTLRLAYTTADGYRKVLSERWKKTPVSDHLRFQIAQRSRYLVAALENALLKMPELSWDECCQKSIEQVNASEGVNFITSSRTVRNWHTNFRSDSCTFDGLINKAHKMRMPKFLEENPEQKTLIVKYALDNLNKLTMQLMHEYIHNTLLPDMKEKLVSELRETLDGMEDGEDKRELEEQIGLVTVDSILKENHLTVLNEETVRQWMHKLGFKYEERKKCFFVDVHEREDVVEDRNAYVEDSLAKDLRRHCWVQKRADDEDLLKLYESDQLQRHQGHKFERNGEEWIEFHVDDHQSFFDWGNENCEYGGKLSVRFPEGQKALIRIGQDEAIFKQYHVTRSAWKGSNGEIGLVPKDDGAGVMISGFISRELGFGIEWTDELRDNVNETRRDQTYKDEEAALEVHSTRNKHDLVDNPLVRFFRYGLNQEGYWNSNHMICQVEDVVDVLKVLVSFDEYHIELALDHSQGHDRLRPDGLTVTNMNLLFGGLQAKMRDSHLTSQDDFGPHPRSLEDFYTANCNFFRKKNQKYEEYIPTDSTAAAKHFNINDTQSMVFTEEDVGPFYLTSADRELYRTDTVIGEGMKQKTADDLRAELDEKFEMEEISCNVCLKGANKKKLVELADLHGIDIKKSYLKIRQGWVGTAKGKLQIAFERGLLDPTKSYDYYSEKGRKDVHESIIEGTSIDKLIQSLRDFREEKTLLQVRAEEMGISIVRSPKCHPEIAGEGIEYSWGVSKNNYRRQPLEQKRGLENFFSLVRESISTDLITKKVARGCSARARAFMLAYRARYLLSLDPSEEVAEELRTNPMCFDLLDKCVKKFRAHRSAIDFDKGFIKGLMLDKMLRISSNAD